MGFIGRNLVKEIEYNKSSVGTKDYRDYLRISVNNPPKTKVVVIMKNPSATCNNQQNGQHTITSYNNKAKCHIDRSTGRVLRKLKGTYDEIYILNLYSLFEPKPLEVNKYYYKSGSTPTMFNSNNIKVQSFLNSFSGDVICAWGKANGIRQLEYDNQINRITSFFNTNHNLLEYDQTSNSFVVRTQSMYPPHGFNWK